MDLIHHNFVKYFWQFGIYSNKLFQLSIDLKALFAFAVMKIITRAMEEMRRNVRQSMLIWWVHRYAYNQMHCGPSFTTSHLQWWTLITLQVNKYYDLATSFYEYGWGQSFHFAHRYCMTILKAMTKIQHISMLASGDDQVFSCSYRLTSETLQESIKRHEHFLALRLKLEPKMKVILLSLLSKRWVTRVPIWSQTACSNHSLTFNWEKLICA